MKEFILRVSPYYCTTRPIDLCQLTSSFSTEISKITVIVEKNVSASIVYMKKLEKMAHCGITAIDFIIEEYGQLCCVMEDHCVTPQTTLTMTITAHYKSSCFVYILFTDSINLFDMKILLQASFSQIMVRGACMIKNAWELVMTTTQQHKAAHSISDVIVKCLAADTAQFRYTGLIQVGEHAVHTKARLENKNMLLSPLARAYTQPQLEVLTNEVQCTHGSAVGRYADEQILYLTMRGLNKKQSKLLLLHAFLGDLFKDEIAKTLQQLVQQQMYELLLVDDICQGKVISSPFGQND
jgi:hypothetical protein